MFDPTIGQWLSEDPIGFEAGDENLRRYVGNGPVNATDPSGRIEVKTVGNFQTPSPGNDPNGLFGAIWIRPTNDEIKKIAAARGGYFIIEDYVRIQGQDRNGVSISGESRQRRLYQIMSLAELDLPEHITFPHQDPDAPKGGPGAHQYHQMFNQKLLPTAACQGTIKVTTVIMLFAGPPSKKVLSHFADPYIHGLNPQYDGHQPDEIGLLATSDDVEGLQGDSTLLGRQTIRYEAHFDYNGVVKPGVFSSTNDFTGAVVTPVPTGPNR